jgi:hypothetical protein
MKERLRCLKEKENFTLGKIYISNGFNYETNEYSVLNNDNEIEEVERNFFISLDEQDMINLLCSLGC